MINRVLISEIKRIIRPLLREKGFDRFESRYCWRHNNEIIDCINFWSPYGNWIEAAVKDIATYSFQVELGICFLAVPNNCHEYSKKGNVILPKITECHHRRFLYNPDRKSLGEGARLWEITPEGNNLEEIVGSVRREIEKKAFNWFVYYGNYKTYLNWLLQNNEYDPEAGSTSGAEGSPAKDYIIGYIAKHLGDNEITIKSLESYLSNIKLLNIEKNIDKVKNDLEEVIGKVK